MERLPSFPAGSSPYSFRYTLDGQQRLWFNEGSTPFYRIDLNTKVLTTVQTPVAWRDFDSLHPISLTTDPQGKVWAVCDSAAMWYDESRNHWQSFPYPVRPQNDNTAVMQAVVDQQADATTDESNATLINCLINGNISFGMNGTEVATIATSGATARTTLLNCEFSNNNTEGGRHTLVNGYHVDWYTSLIIALGSNATNALLNCKAGYNANFIAPRSPTRAVVGNQSGGHTTLSYCVFEDGGATEAPYNPFLEPLEVTPVTYPVLPDPVNPNQVVIRTGITNQDLRNKGNTQAYVDAGGPTTDSNGNPRVVDGQIDIGISEAQVDCPARLYVNTSRSAGRGASWDDPISDLQAALNHGCRTNLTEIWVATGTYKPTSTTARDASFLIPSGVKVYGGFASGETDLNQRNWMANPTILSGDINGAAVVDNSYHVVTFDHASPSTLLDGFTIRQGRASGNVTGTDNSSYHRGGGIYNDGSGAGRASTPLIQNCSIVSNETTGGGGGGFYNDGSNGGNASPKLINCILTTNRVISGGTGGAMYNQGVGGQANPTLINCTLTNNQALVNSSVGGIYNQGTANPTLTNCIVWANGAGALPDNLSGGSPSVTYSILQRGANPTNQVLDSDPLFVSGTYSLTAGSPAINVGNTAAYSAAAGPDKDLAGNTRIQYSLIDLGAIESAFSYDLTALLYARPTTVTGNTNITVVVDVVELNSVASSGPITVRITKDSKVTLSLNPTLTMVNGRSVQNSLWSLSGPSGGFYTLTSPAVIAAGARLSVGLTGMLSPGATTGQATLNVILVGNNGMEALMSNNTDADKIQYFQQ